MEFHLLLLVTVCTVGSQGSNEIKRHLTHDATPPPGIGAEGTCDYGYVQHHGMIESPNFPDRYNDSTNCMYHIYGGVGNIIHIRFWMISIEPHSHCNYDYLLIMNADNEVVGKYCGTDIPAPINITETAHLQFHSDFTTNMFGFQIEYFVSHSECVFGDLSSGCSLPCHCETSASQSVSCDPQTGQCLMGSCRHREAVEDMLEEKWSGPACQIGNLAYDKPATQAGTYNNMDASKAVDRRTGKQDQQRYCAHPDSKNTVDNLPAWWTVDLGEVYRVHNVTIYNTWDIGGAMRLEYFSVRFGQTPDIDSQQVCATRQYPVGNGDHVTLPCDVLTRYISVVRESGVEVTMMTLCEVVVTGHLFTDVDCDRCVGTCAPEIYCDECQTGFMPPSCRVTDSDITCEAPPLAPDHGYRVISGSSFGDTVTYDCNPGFYVDGEKHLACDVNGEWTGDVPTCQRVSCGDAPAEPSFGHILVTGTLYEDLAKYKCDPDYELEGAEEIVCQSSGLWSDNAPVCREIDASCGPPPSVPYGVTIPVNGTTYNSLAKYACSGYLLRGSGLLICTGEGRWTPFGEESECSDCGGAMEARDISTMITHPFSTDKYKHSQNCSWVIYADKPGQSVEVMWFHMDIEPHVDCIHDSLTVYDSNGHRLHKIDRFCGDEILSDIKSIGHMIILNFQSDLSVEMTGFKAEFKLVEAAVNLESALDTFYPDLNSVLGVREKEAGLGNALLYLLDLEITRLEEVPTYVYLVQAIDAVNYLTETVFLPRLQRYFISAFEHTLVHSPDTKVTDIEVAHKLFREVSDPIRSLFGYFTVDFGNAVPANKTLSCFDQILKLAKDAVGQGRVDGKELALEITEQEVRCLELIGLTDKRVFLDQMQSGPFEIYTGSMSPQSMYLLVRAYVEAAIGDVVERLENKLASIPNIVSSVLSQPDAAAIYLEELRIKLYVLVDTIQFLNDVKYNFTENADQYLANIDLGWSLPQQDQYGRPVLQNLIDFILGVVDEQSLQAELHHIFLESLPFDLPLPEVKVRHIEMLADLLVVGLDSRFEGDCIEHKMAALAKGFAEQKIVAIAESTICIEETANTIGDERRIDCDLVKAKAEAFYREQLLRLGFELESLLAGNFSTEMIPLGIDFMSNEENLETLGDFIQMILKVVVPEFEAPTACEVGLSVPDIAAAFSGFSTRLNSWRDLAEEIFLETVGGNSVVYDDVENKIKDILEKEFTDIKAMLEPFTTVSTYPELMEAVSKTAAAFLSQAFVIPEEVSESVDMTPVFDLLTKQEEAMENLVGMMTELKHNMIRAMAAQGVDICEQAPHLC